MESFQQSSRNTANVYVIPQDNSSKKLSATMVGIGSLMVFPFNKEESGHSNSIAEQNHSKMRSQLHFVKMNSWMFGRFQRKLVNESLGTFLSLQKADQEPETDFKRVLVKKSREYRSMIQACVAEMNQLLECLENGKPTPIQEDISELKTNCELLYKMELILGLVEIMFIDKQPGGIVLNQIMTWIRLHFPSYRQKMGEYLSTDKPAYQPQYWETCYGLILQGLLDEARELLSLHPDSNKDSFLSMDELLRKMPSYVVYSGISESEFLVRWNHWQSECESRLVNGEFSSCKQLETICKILSGDQEVMHSLMDMFDTWYHLMASQLLYTNPTIKMHRLASAAQEAIITKGVESHMKPLDQLILAIFEDEDYEVLKLVQSVLNNQWFMVHLSDLLCHALDRADMSYLNNIRQSVILDYGSELCSHSSMWQIGLLYLDVCGGVLAPTFVETVLQRVPLTSDRVAFKVIQAANDRDMDHVVKSVCRVMARKALQLTQLGSAIWWGVRSQDASFTSHLAHKILQNYMKSGEFQSSSLLDHLGPAMLQSDILTFLSKYREFHMLYQAGNLKSAASLLVSLIASRLAPDYFLPILLEDSLPLLQSPEPVITVEQTYKLVYCLHNLSVNSIENDTKETPMYTSFLDKEKDIKLALTNNLARSIIEEGTFED